MSLNSVKQISYDTLLDLATPEGINASGKDGVFGCIFGRDSAITILKMLRVHSKEPSNELLEIAHRGLLTLVSLQGKQFNIECGEEPGKFIHEFRRKEETDHYKALISHPEFPWYTHEDGTIKNYDSIDSTPLTLIALYKYYQLTQDKEFLVKVLPAIELGLNWIITYGDLDKDFLIEYEFKTGRKHGGLLVQSWTDSHESMRQADGKMPKYPIAPVEAQGYAWLALKLWGEYFQYQHPTFAKKLLSQAKNLKKVFNKQFKISDRGMTFFAQALDGDKNQIKTVTGNPLLCLWASYKNSDGSIESIIDKKYIPDMVKRAFMEDMFEKDAGVRTMSTLSTTYNQSQNSYHNGAFWPVLNGMSLEGLENFGFTFEAQILRDASHKPLEYFGSPIELYIKTGDGEFQEYLSPTGQTSCKYQAWSAASALDWLT